ncbi:polysaccharide lyase family protein [Paenibacillus sp. RC67]|uniref:polysaccharide lyase family protein n=1 Tax=Paenibacillus sp. RC67 TaxID=3039392 RepID=UPI0024ACEC79|nr:polysaccharide lyase family protein [Paenibacillus sp. RC67]
MTSAQAAAAHTLKIGITAAYNNGRPSVAINGTSLSVPSASTQPNSRSITIGTYRGNNTTFTWSIPATNFVAGTNTLTITPASGSSDLSSWLSAGWAYDCVELDN